MNNTFESILNRLNKISESYTEFDSETLDVYSCRIHRNDLCELQKELANEEWILVPEDIRIHYDGRYCRFTFHETIRVGNLSQGTLLDGKDSDAGVTFCRDWEIRYSPTMEQWVRVDSVSEETPEPILKTR